MIPAPLITTVIYFSCLITLFFLNWKIALCVAIMFWINNVGIILGLKKYVDAGWDLFLTEAEKALGINRKKDLESKVENN